MSDELLQAPAVTACPTEEEIACLVDGVLAPPEAERLLEHLLGCPRCHELYTALLHLELERQGEPAGEEAGVLRFPRRTLLAHPVLRWGSMAAGLIVAAGLAYLTGAAWLAKSRPSEEVKRRVASIAPNPQVFGHLFVHRLSPDRGLNQSNYKNLTAYFWTGVLWTDIGVALERHQLDELTATLPGFQAAAAELDPTLFDELQELINRAKTAKAVGDVEPDLQRILLELDELPDSSRAVVRLGQWWETGRIAAELKDRRFFASLEQRKFLTWLLDDPKFGGDPLPLERIDPALPGKLQQIANLWPSESTQTLDYSGLAKLFDEVLGLPVP